MRKKIISEEQISILIANYTDDLMSSDKLMKKFNLPKRAILQILKDNNIVLRKSGRLNLGGKSEADKRYYKKNKNKISNYYSNWQSKNRNHLREYHRQWRIKNLDHLRETKRNYEKTRKSKDPVYKLISNFRTAICTVLKEHNIVKYNHYFEALGYTQQDLINHLDSLLNDGMTWENYGKWHVDHKIPIDAFNFMSMNDPEFKKCWSLENLQPMWEEENISKGNHIL